MNCWSILISEVGPRDGLQSVKATMPTADKCAWIDALVAAGLREIEVGSFVPAAAAANGRLRPKWCKHALQYPGLTVMALVPNLRGRRRAAPACTS
jgi:hydroxymethylglutaryl-CoA lyase